MALPADPSERFIQELANVFREARERAGLSQKALATKAKVGRTGVITFEQGSRVLSGLILHKLAQGMGRRLSELIAEAEVKASTGTATRKRKQQ